jgi:translation initiation factor IF-2
MKEKTKIVVKKAKPAAAVKQTKQEKPAVHAAAKRAVKQKEKTVERAAHPRKKAAVHKKPAAVEKPAAVLPVPPAPAVKPAVHPAHPVKHEAPAPVAPVVKPAVPPAVAAAKSAPHPPVEAVKPHVQSQPPQPVAPAPVPEKPKVEPRELELNIPITVKDLSIKLQEKPSVLIKNLMLIGMMAGINQPLGRAELEKIGVKYNFKIKEAPSAEEEALSAHDTVDTAAELTPRPPIVTFMGHVDHGKTSLLDAIRKSTVAEKEHGGITQHIGAYKVKMEKGSITFLDTPGHEAFTAMRARGAKATDVVVLVVAADDGLMPQTQEAIDHARAAGVSIIVAINKIDKPQADVDRVKKQLAALELMAEDWGGKTITVPVSAKTGEGIDTLLEMILLESEILELKANPARLAKGVVLEGKLVKNKGPVATLIVQNGTLRLNDNIIVGSLYGKVRAMFNDRGQHVQLAPPSTPVEVLGINGIPQAGEQFFALENENAARSLAQRRQETEKQKQMMPIKRMGLEDLYSQIKEGKLKELKLILKADAQGSIEAITDAIGKINSPEVKIIMIHEGIGNINYSDVILALASDALILGFNVSADDQAKALVDKEGQDVRTYHVIYEIVNDIRAALEGMLEPKLKKVFVGRAEVRKVFKLSTSGIIAGSFVTKGKIARSARVDVIRNGQTVHEGELASLKRFKDDVKEVEEGYECGIQVKGFPDVMEGDIIEAYQVQKIARTLD